MRRNFARASAGQKGHTMSEGSMKPGRHYFRAGGHRLAYHVHGAGEPVIAIPGGPGFSHSYLRMPLLERRSRMLYLDNIGSGDSDRFANPAGYSRALDVANLEALREHLQRDRLTLLGHSAGGFIAQQYALDHPGRVERLVLYATTPTNGAAFDISLADELEARSRAPGYADAIACFRQAFTSLLEPADADRILGEAFKLYLYDFEADGGAVLQTLRRTSSLDIARMQRGTSVDFDYRPGLPSLDMPVLIVSGSRDFICAPRLAEMIHACIPGSRLLTMQRSGHLAHLEEPGLFAEAVASFLAEPGSGATGVQARC
jgi:proline iminopeptidase